MVLSVSHISNLRLELRISASFCSCFLSACCDQSCHTIPCDFMFQSNSDGQSFDAGSKYSLEIPRLYFWFRSKTTLLTYDYLKRFISEGKSQNF